MQHHWLKWLLLGGLGATLLACGDSGSATGIPPAGLGYGVGDDPYGNFNEPPGTDNEVPVSYTELGTCGIDSTMRFSELVKAASLPLCTFERSCSDSVVQPTDPPDEPGPGGPNSGGDMEPRNLDPEPEEIPSFCLELAMSRTPGGQEMDDCLLMESLYRVAIEFPACNPVIALPMGWCAARIQRCVQDIVAGGCAAYLSEDLPSSCAGLE